MSKSNLKSSKSDRRSSIHKRANATNSLLPSFTFSIFEAWGYIYLWQNHSKSVPCYKITAGVSEIECAVRWCGAQMSLEYGSGPEDLLFVDSLLYRRRERIPPTQQSTKQTATAAAYRIRWPNLLGSHRLW